MRKTALVPDVATGRNSRTCFVCGCPNSATFMVRTKPNGSSEPHFPFLENHEPPVGCEVPSRSEGKVAACNLCYSFLVSQWDSHEQNNTPHSTRLYWLKRVDQGPYSSGSDRHERSTEEMRHPEMTSPPERVQERSSVLVQSDVSNSLKRPRSRSRDIHQGEPLGTETGPTRSKVERSSPHHVDVVVRPETKEVERGEVEDEEPPEALDLRSSASVNREKDGERVPSRNSVMSAESGSSSNPLGEMGSGGILDLSMPDKNAAMEVCYVCGDEYAKGTLSHIYAKPIQHGSFFPSLMLHPRPSRSRPMDSAGRVQACEVCMSHLLQQWTSHQLRNTPHAERHYALRKRPALQAYDPTTFFCYACGLEYPSSSLRLLYCRPNAESEPYFPYLENIKAPVGSSPISPQGMVQVCAICYKSIPQRHKVFGTGSETSLPAARSPVQRAIQSQTTQASLPPPVPNRMSISEDASDLPVELYCYVCHRTCMTEAMKMLCCYPPDRRHSSAGISGPPPVSPKVMHFPFLKTLAKPVGPSYFDASKNRTLVCSDCFLHFQHQWLVFEEDGLALELRHYTLPPAVHHRPLPRSDTKDNRSPCPPSNVSPPMSNQRAAEGLLMLQTVTSSKPPGSSSSVSPGHGTGRYQASSRPVIPPISPSGGAERRPPSSQSSNRTPPSTTTPAQNTVSTPSSVIQDQPKENKSGGTSDSSIYCFLCSLNSTRSFAHWLPSSPSSSDPAAPYFPYILNYAAGSRAESLREDGAALVCTFCFHMVHSQWKQYEDAPASKSLQPSTRVYNTHDYVCYVCGIATYRKRVRALPVKDFPFLKQHRQPRHSLSIEKGQFVVVCLDCFESLRTQSLEYERWGLPVEKRQYNWMAIPPPPEDSEGHLSTPLERLLAMEEQKRRLKDVTVRSKELPSSDPNEKHQSATAADSTTATTTTTQQCPASRSTTPADKP